MHEAQRERLGEGTKGQNDLNKVLLLAILIILSRNVKSLTLLDGITFCSCRYNMITFESHFLSVSKS